MAPPANPAGNPSVDCTEPAFSENSISENSAARPRFPRDSNGYHRPFFCSETSDWQALQPAEQAEVVLAAYQERVLPELARIETLLTRLAVEVGLEYCRIDELAVHFLDVARGIRHHVQSLEAAAGSLAENVPPPELSANKADIHGLIARLDSVTSSSATRREATPCSARLIERLRKSQQELADLVDFKPELPR